MVIKKAPTIVLALLILSLINLANAMPSVGQIDVFKPASSDPIVLVYWNYSVPKGCDQREASIVFQALSEAQRILKSSIYRFISEHPNQFDDLALLRFENVSDPRKAEVIYGVYVLEEAKTGGAVTIYGDRAWELHLDCKLAEMDHSVRLNVAMHELLHTLGLGHVHEGGEDFEVMNVASEAYYPSTLDLFAIYRVMFEKKWNEPVTLPNTIEWKPVIPYAIELKQLQQKLSNLNEKISSLQTQVVDLSNDVKRLEEEKSALFKENQRLNANLVSFRKLVEELEAENADLESRLGEYKSLVSALNRSLSEALETIKSQNEEIQSLKTENRQLSSQLQDLRASLNETEVENQALRQQLQQANQTILALAILTICLVAITIAAITLKKRR